MPRATAICWAKSFLACTTASSTTSYVALRISTVTPVSDGGSRDAAAKWMEALVVGPSWLATARNSRPVDSIGIQQPACSKDGTTANALRVYETPRHGCCTSRRAKKRAATPAPSAPVGAPKTLSSGEKGRSALPTTTGRTYMIAAPTSAPRTEADCWGLGRRKVNANSTGPRQRLVGTAMKAANSQIAGLAKSTSTGLIQNPLGQTSSAMHQNAGAASVATTAPRRDALIRVTKGGSDRK